MANENNSSSEVLDQATDKMPVAAQVSSPSRMMQNIEAFHSKWWKKRSRWEKEVFAFIVAPTVLVGLYCGLLASPMYVSETKFAVHTGAEQSVGIDIASTFFKTASSSIQDAEVVNAYIRSPDMFAVLDDKLQLVDHYASTKWDKISRLNASPTLWDKQSFWNNIAKPVVDADTGIVTFKVRAYTPEMAHNISAEVLRQSEALVNKMNDRARRDALSLAEAEVDIAQARVAKAQRALTAFRTEHAELDPQATAAGLQSLVFELEGKRAALKTEIANAESFMNKNAPELDRMRGKLVALEKQLAYEKSRMVGTGRPDALNAWVAEYESLMVENEFARKQLTAAMSAVESARTMLLTKTRYIIAIEQPTLPDEARYPLTWVATIGAFLGLSLLYGLVRLIIASIREHAGF